MLEVVRTSEKERWDRIVKSFPQYDVYHLNGYSKAFQLHGDGEPLLFYGVDGDFRAANIVMKRDIAEAEVFQGTLERNTYFDLITPYGYGGFLTEGRCSDFFKQEYEEYCRNHSIVSEFVRFNPLLVNWKGLDGMYDINCLGNTVEMPLLSEEEIWKNLSSKNRNVIRKAQKFGLKTYWSRSPEMIDLFMDIYKQTMDRDMAASYYYFKREFYECILEDLKNHALWFYTQYEGRIAAMSIFLFADNKMHYHLSCSVRELQYLAPTNLLLYDAAVWGCENGYRVLHLGGGVGIRKDNLYKFKKAFNRREDCSFWVGKKIYSHDIYHRLMEYRGGSSEISPDTDFFPAYRKA